MNIQNEIETTITKINNNQTYFLNNPSNILAERDAILRDELDCLQLIQKLNNEGMDLQYLIDNVRTQFYTDRLGRPCSAAVL